MAFSRQGKIMLGVSGALAGAGALLYALQGSHITGSNASLASVTVTLSPPPQNPYPAGLAVATVAWVNPSTSAVAYAVQGDIVQGGVVTGHWWTSQAADNAALAAYQQGGRSALRPYELAASNRVATLTVQPGGQGRVVLYARLLSSIQTGGAETWSFLVLPGYRSGLIVSDPLGTPLSTIQGSPASRWVLAVPAVA